jgi:hypothetical protein
MSPEMAYQRVLTRLGRAPREGDDAESPSFLYVMTAG